MSNSKRTKKADAPAKPKEIGLFDFVSSINSGCDSPSLMEGCTAANETLDKARVDSAYVAFMVNRAMSYHYDTVLIANEMNRFPALPAKMQYDFLKGCTPPRRRFSKWEKMQPATEDVKLLMRAYVYSQDYARQVISLFDANALNTLRDQYATGGLQKK